MSTPAAMLPAQMASARGTRKGSLTERATVEGTLNSAPKPKPRAHHDLGRRIVPTAKPSATWRRKTQSATDQAMGTGKPDTARRQAWNPKTAPIPVASETRRMVLRSAFDSRIVIASPWVSRR